MKQKTSQSDLNTFPHQRIRNQSRPSALVSNPRCSDSRCLIMVSEDSGVGGEWRGLNPFYACASCPPEERPFTVARWGGVFPKGISTRLPLSLLRRVKGGTSGAAEVVEGWCPGWKFMEWISRRRKGFIKTYRKTRLHLYPLNGNKVTQRALGSGRVHSLFLKLSLFFFLLFLVSEHSN